MHGCNYNFTVKTDAEVSKVEEINQNCKGMGLLDTLETPVYVDEETGEWHLSMWDIECIAIGTGILGCGGGCSSHLGRLMCRKALERGKKIRIIHPQR